MVKWCFSAPVLAMGVLAQSCGAAAADPTVNSRPIVGILTQPEGTETNTSDRGAYIAASYVKFAEMAGARVVPVFHNGSASYLNRTFHSLNGLLMPGGGSNIGPGTDLHNAGQFLFNKTLQANDAGDVFPIWGTCMGFQFLSILAAGTTSVLCGDCFTTEGMSLPLNFTSAAPTSKLLADMAANQADLYVAAGSEPLTPNSHHDGILVDVFNDNEKLSGFFDVLSTNTDPHNGREFVSTIEAKHYPIMATQWHPEKCGFEWNAGAAVTHTAHSVRLMQYVANAFVSHARLSQHKFETADEEVNALIYNYVPKYQPYGYFDQSYYFDDKAAACW